MELVHACTTLVFGEFIRGTLSGAAEDGSEILVDVCE